MLVAEKSFRKRIMGGIDLSTVMNLWLQWSQTWNLVIKILKGNGIVKTLVLQEAESSDISHPVEDYFKESQRGCKIWGDEVELFRPYS